MTDTGKAYRAESLARLLDEAGLALLTQNRHEGEQLAFKALKHDYDKLIIQRDDLQRKLRDTTLELANVRVELAALRDGPVGSPPSPADFAVRLQEATEKIRAASEVINTAVRAAGHAGAGRG
jgi:hypothetical protein